MTLFTALDGLSACQTWQDVAAECAGAVWSRNPEAQAAWQAVAGPHERDDDLLDQVGEVRDQALRVGAVIGVALTRITPRVPEDLLDIIRLATGYAGLAVYDVPVALPDDGDDEGGDDGD
jgi:hypothetical protein